MLALLAGSQEHAAGVDSLEVAIENSGRLPRLAQPPRKASRRGEADEGRAGLVEAARAEIVEGRRTVPALHPAARHPQRTRKLLPLAALLLVNVRPHQRY